MKLRYGLVLLLASISYRSFSQTTSNDTIMKNIQSKTVVFIHGAFVSYTCWDEWRTYFESKGYKTIAPPWPHKEDAARVLRERHPDAAIASLRLNQLVHYYDSIIRQLPEKPILIGHSYGGLLVQLLLQRDLAAAGIAIHSVPPKGVLSFKLSFLRSVWGPLGLFTSAKKTFLMSFSQWQYAFANGMPLEEQKKHYEKLVVPESKQLNRDGLTNDAKVDFRKPRAPLLFVAGDKDHIMPASLNYDTYKKYKKGNSITDFKKFEGRNHLVLGLPTWKENADHILSWIQPPGGANLLTKTE